MDKHRDICPRVTYPPLEYSGWLSRILGPPPSSSSRYLLCISRADKWYALVWYHVCPLAWLKMTKLCPCLSYFHGSFGHFESLAFFRTWGDKPYTTAVKHNILVKFWKKWCNKVTIFQKSPAILTKKMRTKLTVDNYRSFFNKKLLRCGKIVGFWTVFWGQRWQHWYVDDQNTIKANQSHMNV